MAPKKKGDPAGHPAKRPRPSGQVCVCISCGVNSSDRWGVNEGSVWIRSPLFWCFLPGGCRHISEGFFLLGSTAKSHDQVRVVDRMPPFLDCLRRFSGTSTTLTARLQGRLASPA
eukprot:5056364-Pyramimonas_sp.AAC.1